MNAGVLRYKAASAWSRFSIWASGAALFWKHAKPSTGSPFSSPRPRWRGGGLAGREARERARGAGGGSSRHASRAAGGRERAGDAGRSGGFAGWLGSWLRATHLLSKAWQGMEAAACGQALARGAHGGEGEGLEEESEGEGDDEGDEGAGSREERMQVLKGALERLPHCLAEVCRKSLPSLIKEPYDTLQKRPTHAYAALSSRASTPPGRRVWLHPRSRSRQQRPRHARCRPSAPEGMQRLYVAREARTRRQMAPGRVVLPWKMLVLTRAARKTRSQPPGPAGAAALGCMRRGRGMAAWLFAHSPGRGGFSSGLQALRR